MTDFKYELVQVSKVASSSNHQDTKADNVLDGNADTKWSAKNEKGKAPQFLTLDTGEKAQTVSGIAIKFYESDIRRQQYSMYYSNKGGDNEADWRRIGTAVSSGNANNEYEENIFERPITARYFKVVGEGNTLNKLISIVDIKLLGAKKPEEEQVLIAGDIATPEMMIVGDAPQARERVDIDPNANKAAGDETKGASVKADTVNDTNSNPNANKKVK